MTYQVYTENGEICVYLADHKVLLHITTEEYRPFCQEIGYHGMRIEAERRNREKKAKR